MTEHSPDPDAEHVTTTEVSGLTLEELVKAGWELDDQALQVVRYGPY